MRNYKSILALCLIAVFLTFSACKVIVIPNRHDNGKHKGWSNPNNPHSNNYNKDNKGNNENNNSNKGKQNKNK